MAEEKTLVCRLSGHFSTHTYTHNKCITHIYGLWTTLISPDGKLNRSPNYRMKFILNMFNEAFVFLTNKLRLTTYFIWLHLQINQIVTEHYFPTAIHRALNKFDYIGFVVCDFCFLLFFSSYKPFTY